MTFLLSLAKEAVLRKVEDRVRKLDRSYVQKWVTGDLWIADTIARKYERDVHAWRNVVRDTLATITPEDLLAACRNARPDLADLWGTAEARTKMQAEWERGRAWVERL